MGHRGGGGRGGSKGKRGGRGGGKFQDGGNRGGRGGGKGRGGGGRGGHHKNTPPKGLWVSEQDDPFTFHNAKGKVKMSMRQEALLTSSKRERSNLPLRRIPVEFLKAAEPYNPSKIIYGLENLELKQDKDRKQQQRKQSSAPLVERKQVTVIEDESDEEDFQPQKGRPEPKISEKERFEKDIVAETIIDDDDDDLIEEAGSSPTEPSFYMDTEGDDSLSLERGSTNKVPNPLPYYKKPQQKLELSEESVKNIENYREEENEVKSTIVSEDISAATTIKERKTNHHIPDESEYGDVIPNIPDEGFKDFSAEELNSLKQMAARDIQNPGDGSYHYFSSDNDDLNEPHANHLPDGLSLLSYMNKITQTVYDSTGRRFRVDWTEDYAYALPEFVSENDIYNSLFTLGYNEEDITDIIKTLGGSISDDEGDDDDDEVDDDDDDDDLGYDSYYDSFNNGYFDSYDYDEEDELELDRVVSQLINQENGTSSRSKGRKDAILESYGSDRLPTPSGKIKKNKMPAFDTGDEELDSQLEKTWTGTKEARRRKKEERELARREGRLSRQYKNYLIPSLRDVYPHHMTMDDVVYEIRNLLSDPGRTTVALPPMDKNARKVVQDVGQIFNLTTKCKSDGHKFIIYTKNSGSKYLEDDSHLVAKLKGKRSYFIRIDLKKQKGAIQGPAPAPGEKRAKPAHKPKEGDIVGSKASEIGSENIGRLMLEKMGWQKGMGLGTTNVGIVEPITAKVKNTKWGIGKSDDPT